MLKKSQITLKSRASEIHVVNGSGDDDGRYQIGDGKKKKKVIRGRGMYLSGWSVLQASMKPWIHVPSSE